MEANSDGSTTVPIDDYPQYPYPYPYYPPYPYIVTPARTGWICPKCGAVNSPDVNQCPCTSYHFSITCSSNGTAQASDSEA